MPKKSKKQSAADRSVPKKARTNRPKDPVKSQAGKASAAARKAKREKGDPVTRPCSARRTNGEPCKNSAIRGGTVCARHGGSAPQVRAKANQRLIEMVLPAMKELSAILNNPNTADADKLKAINMVLNRTGYSERQQIDLGLREPSPFDSLSATAFRIVRGEGMRDELEAMAEHPELPTPNDASGGVGDADLDAFLARRERDREAETQSRLDNHGHEVVEGRVQRQAMDPFANERQEREEFGRRTSAYDPRRGSPEGLSFEERLLRDVEETERRTGRKR